MYVTLRSHLLILSPCTRNILAQSSNSHEERMLLSPSLFDYCTRPAVDRSCTMTLVAAATYEHEIIIQSFHSPLLVVIGNKFAKVERFSSAP